LDTFAAICRPIIEAHSVVVTTLARCREHPFTMQAAWDFVVIDECLSVQNDTALHTAQVRICCYCLPLSVSVKTWSICACRISLQAWREVEASKCGVMMLSATFFRSRFTKLFYMLRMLRSPLPRIERYLAATLCEHIVCYVPRQRREWHLQCRYV